MKSNLVKAASEVIPNPKILVNMVSQRVRQLCLGSRPMVEFVPGLGHADVALWEMAGGKLSFELPLKKKGNDPVPKVVDFPSFIVKKPKKKAPKQVLFCPADAIADLLRAARHMRKRN